MRYCVKRDAFCLQLLLRGRQSARKEGEGVGERKHAYTHTHTRKETEILRYAGGLLKAPFFFSSKMMADSHLQCDFLFLVF